MSDAWIDLLSSLRDEGHALRDGLTLISPRSKPPRPYKKAARPRSYYKEEFLIDWRALYNISGSSAMYKLNSPWIGLLYYDHIFLGINSCPESEADNFNVFSLADMPIIIQKAREGSVVFYLTDRPEDYARYPYLRELFEEFRPLHLASASAGISKTRDLPAFDRKSEAVTDRPHVAEALRRYSAANHIAFEVADATTCFTIQDLYYRGYEKLAEALLIAIDEAPDAAIPLVMDIRRAVVEPSDESLGMPFAFETTAFRSSMVYSTSINHSPNATRLPEIGQVLSQVLSFPSPTNFEGLRWCEEHLDIGVVRRAFGVMEQDTRSATYSMESEKIKAFVEDSWSRRNASFSNLKNGLNWTSSLGIAATGALINQPVMGLLAGLGFAVTEKLWLEPVTRSATRLFQPKSYHIWDATQRLTRRTR